MRIGLHVPRWSHWVPPVVWTLLLVALSGDQGSSLKTFHIFHKIVATFTNLHPKTIVLLHNWFRKSLHVIFYGILSVLWFRALIATFPGRRIVCLILTLFLCLGVSLIDEGHQSLLDSRTGALKDVGLDMAGVLLFMLITAWYWWRKAKVSSPAQPPFP